MQPRNFLLRKAMLRKRGDFVLYWNGSAYEPALVAAAHHDDVLPYYTVTRVDGSQRQTVGSRLLSPPY